MTMRPIECGTTQGPFALRGFRYRRDGSGIRFIVTLVYGSRVIARVSGTVGQKDAAGETAVEVAVVDTFYWGEFDRHVMAVPLESNHEDPRLAWILAGANDLYHRRRLQVISLRSTAFVLHGDKPGTFRYLRNRPYSLEVHGSLRVTFGRRLKAVYRDHLRQTDHG